MKVVRILPKAEVSIIGESSQPDSERNPNSLDPDLQMLCEMFPETPAEVMEQIYLTLNKNTQAVIDELLDSTYELIIFFLNC